VARLDPIPVEKLSPEQKAIHEKVRGNRTVLGGPFSVLLYHPELAKAASGVVDVLRRDGKLDKRLYELIVLTVARHWGAHYAWAVHEPLGLAAGLTNQTIEALRAKRKPEFSKADEALVFDAVTQLMGGRVLSTATYDRLMKEFGLDITLEIVATSGLYSMIATVLNGFDVPTMPPGERTFS
jgi:4-carboxymuconolactone decarboxylase